MPDILKKFESAEWQARLQQQWAAEADAHAEEHGYELDFFFGLMADEEV